MKNNTIYKTKSGEKKIISLYDEILSNWPIPYDGIYLQTRLGNTFVIACGNETAPALILIHGAASNSASWIADVTAYSKNYRVFILDVPGEPGKSDQNRSSWQGMGYAEWMEDIMTGLNLDKAILVGLSQGGWIALRYAACNPQKVAKIVLLAPAGIVPTKISFIAKAVLLSLWGKAGTEKLNRIVFGKQSIHPDAVKFMNAIMLNLKPRFEKEYIFSDSELVQLSMPVLVIGGQEDVIRSSRAMIKRLSNLIPGLEYILLPETGHVLVNLTQKIIPFLEKR